MLGAVVKFFREHRAWAVWITIVLVNLPLWLVPSNLEKMRLKSHPIYLGMYSLERMSFLLFVAVPVSVMAGLIITTTDRKARRRRIFAAVTMVGATLMSLVVVDVVVRCFDARYVKTGEVYHRPPNEEYTVKVRDVLPEELAAGGAIKTYPETECTLSTDKFGFRNHSPLLSRYDIVALGDSFTEGSNVSDDRVWPVLLAKQLGENVYNLGMSGSDPVDYWLAFERFGVPLKPKTVVCAIYEGNDFRDKLAPGRIRSIEIKRGADGKMDFVQKPKTLGEKMRELKKTSPVIMTLRKWLRLLLSREPAKGAVAAKSGSGSVSKSEGGLSWLPVVRVEGGVCYFMEEGRLWQIAEAGKGFKDTKGWLAAAEALRRLKKTCDTIGAKLIVCFVPSKEEMVLRLIPPEEIPAEGLREYVSLKSKWLPPADELKKNIFANLGMREKTLRAFCAEEDVGFVSFSQPLLDAMKRGTQVYFSYDQHWTPDGHAVVAKALERALRGAKREAEPQGAD